MRMLLYKLGVAACGTALLILLLLALSWCSLLTVIVHAQNPQAQSDFGFDKGVTWPVARILTQEGNSCVGYAWATWEEALPSTPRQLDGMYIYRNAQYLDGIPGESYEGTTIQGGANVLEAENLISVYTTTSDIYEVVNYLRWGGPVVIESVWYQGMNAPAPDGYAIPTGAVGGIWHAYVCNNYVDSGPDGESFGCVNSYGERWGNRGRFRIHLRDLRYLLSHNQAYAVLADKVADYRINISLRNQ